MSLLDELTFGTCYYPEHWPAEMWEPDLIRMRESGMQVVRLGEGAWGYFEPVEGQYQFETFDRVLDLCAKHGLRVIFGTPTYSGPAWIATKYPEVMRCNYNRVPMGHGSRRSYNYTSPKYLELCDKICTALATRYKNHPAIVAWQLDNEFNCHMDVSYAPTDTAAFRVWLKEKYTTLDALNEAWGTRFWSQQYGSWDELDLPHPTATYHNPTQLLDETRFISDCVVRFVRRQAAILRQANPAWAITHNGLFSNIDGPALAGELSFMSHDHYPLFHDCDWAQAGVELSLARSLSDPFCIMEHQAGPGGQMSYLHRTLYPGELRRLCWQSLAHGTRSLLWFLWRTCPFGSEQHWHGLHDQDDAPTRKLDEAEQVMVEAKTVASVLRGQRRKRVVGILRDFDSETNERRVDTYVGTASGEAGRVMKCLLKHHVPVDFVWTSGKPAQTNLSDFKLVFVPHLKLLRPEVAARLEAYVQAGGTLVITGQTGLKDVNNHIVSAAAPGLLADLVGAIVTEWTTLTAPAGVSLVGIKAEFIGWAEVLEVTTGKVLATYDRTHPLLGDRPAGVVNKVGAGTVIYLGGYLPEDAIASILPLALRYANLAQPTELPTDVEVAEYPHCRILINHGTQPFIYTLNGGRSLLGQTISGGQITLAAGDVAVIQLDA